MEKNSFEYYVERYIDGTISADEWAVLRQMIQRIENEDYLNRFMDEQISVSASQPDAFPVVTNRILSSVEQKIGDPSVVAIKSSSRHVLLLRRWWVAASILFLLCIGAYFWIGDTKNTPSATITQQTVEVPPGKEGAILTLADGRQVMLDSMGNGLVAMQLGADVVLRQGTLAYEGGGSIHDETASSFNTLSTPNGRLFNVLLPDGTRVWLNAASSLRYPTVFTGKERRVEITGEAYFEVARNKKMPFRVHINDRAEVEVLGTHFNVNAYEDEGSINATLMEGSVRVLVVSSHQPPVTLKPGQQAQVVIDQQKQPGIKVINNADTEKIMAWKNGLFNFEGASLEEVMRQLERWYDIEVVYEKGIPREEFEGKITRDMTLNELLPALEKMGVRYRLEGRKLTLLP